MTVDEFYDVFEQHLESLLTELSIARVAGVVIGPNGEPVQGIAVWTGIEGTYRSWSVRTAQDGLFSLHIPDGTYTIKLYVRGDTSWRHVGWYGQDGLVTDRSQATEIEGGGPDVTGIDIHLPANPADLPTIE